MAAALMRYHGIPERRLPKHHWAAIAQVRYGAEADAAAPQHWRGPKALQGRRSASAQEPPPQAQEPREPMDVRAGELINGRWQVLHEAGRGNFARVVAAVDSMTKAKVAVKLLRRDTARWAKAEQDALALVAQKDPHNRQRVVRMHGAFQWQGTRCIVMPLMGVTLRSRRLGLRSGAVSRGDVAVLARQLGGALSFLHNECGLVHTDLKPENILLDGPAKRNELGPGWVIADLGNSWFLRPGHNMSDLISTRPYRAIEVILKRPWGFAADMWSLGCILAEVWSGEQIFFCHEDGEQLRAFHQRLGCPPPWFPHMYMAPGPTKQLASLEILCDDNDFVDLLRHLLCYDSRCRMRAEEVARHRFCAATSDAPPAGSGEDARCGRPVSRPRRAPPPPPHATRRLSPGPRGTPPTTAPIAPRRRSTSAAPPPRGTQSGSPQARPPLHLEHVKLQPPEHAKRRGPQAAKGAERKASRSAQVQSIERAKPSASALLPKPHDAQSDRPTSAPERRPPPLAPAAAALEAKPQRAAPEPPVPAPQGAGPEDVQGARAPVPALGAGPTGQPAEGPDPSAPAAQKAPALVASLAGRFRSVDRAVVHDVAAYVEAGRITREHAVARLIEITSGH